MNLYPLKFHSIYKDKIWGGYNLRKLPGKTDVPEGKIGESWDISGVEGNISVVKNGFLKDNTLKEIIEVYMGDLVGDKVFDEYGLDFPLLIKWIDTTDLLSVQVHPDDEMANELHNSFGKTECWYVVDSKEDSKIYTGLKNKITKDDFVKSFKNNKILDELSFTQTNPGDTFFIPAGKIHAIGKNILLAEIQQTSDITYRLYDWDRVDDNGNPRELHVENAINAIDFENQDNGKILYELKKNKSSELVSCNFFKVNCLNFDKPIAKNYNTIDSFVVYLCTEGAFVIKYSDNEEVLVEKGETVLIPADLKEPELYPKNDCKILEVFIP